MTSFIIDSNSSKFTQFIPNLSNQVCGYKFIPSFLVISGPDHYICDGLLLTPLGPGMFLQDFLRNKIKQRTFSITPLHEKIPYHLFKHKLQIVHTINSRGGCWPVRSYKYLQRYSYVKSSKGSSLLWRKKSNSKQIWNHKSKYFNGDAQSSPDSLQSNHGQSVNSSRPSC